MILGGRALKTVFLLGAGATRGAVPRVLFRRKRLKAPLNGDFFDVAQTYARAQGLGSADDRRVKHLLDVFKKELPLGRSPTLEEAFSALFVAKDFPEIYKRRPGRRPAPGESSEIDDFLTLLFAILVELDRGATPTGYDRFVGSLSADDTILTLNYDTCLDSALVRAGWDPRTGYGISGGAAKCRWQPPTGMDSSHLSNVRLLKLHGSLNWWVNGDTSRLGQVFNKKPSLVSKPRANGFNGKMRQVVPPIYGKFFSHPHWQSLWKQAFDALLDAEALVVVGCSIVDTDFHLQSFFRRLIRERKDTGTPLKLALLVDRSRIRKRWRRLLKTGTKRFIPFPTFESLIARGLHT